MPKQTAANNVLLADTKHWSNHLIFKKCSKLVNTKGEPEAVEYLLTFVREDLRDAERDRLASLMSRYKGE